MTERNINYAAFSGSHKYGSHKRYTPNAGRPDRTLVRILSLTLVLAMVLTAAAGFGKSDGRIAANAAAGEINDHKQVTSNGNYTLYVNDETLSLIIRDNLTGATMESSITYDDGESNKSWYGAMNSAVVLTMINGNDDSKQANTFNDMVTKKVTHTPYGFTADIYWTKYKLGLTLEVELTNEGLTVRVPDESIREDGTDYQIGTISLYPYLGSSYMDDKEGYIFIPDGNGALIYLNDKEGRYKSGYSSMIYGHDIGFEDTKVESLLWDKYKIINSSEQIIAPVFGIAHTDDKMAYLGIVEDGSMRAMIEGMPNGVSVNYNRAYAKFIERKYYTQPTSNNSTVGSLKISESERSHSDLKVRYIFLSGDRANYAGMAGAYREYLLANGLLKQTDDGFRTRVDFLGSDREQWVIGTSAVVMTTADDIRGIYADLKERGVTGLLTVYKGWQKGGIYNIPVSKFKAEGKLGGTGEISRLAAEAADSGIGFYLYDDALRINPSEYNVTFNVVKRINKRKYEENTHKEVYKTFNYVTPARSTSDLKKLIKNMTAKNVTGLCVAGITSNMFSYTYGGTNYTRYQCGNAYAELLETADEQLDMVMEQPGAYLWKNTQAFLDMPLYTSSYIIEDEFVPFLSIVLKGVMPVYSEYVNFEANRQEFFLKMIESGTYPSFYITKESSSELIYTNSNDIYSSAYETYADTIEEYARELKKVNDAVKGAVITAHEIKDGVVRVTYSNGVKIYVNYGESAAAIDGLTLEPMSYILD
ncbi:MAG: hypothetical protein K6G81_07110 [Lachnospiraceae bacterium]|nr:hypothetical protein [Lachnospiraceae bacterium]